MAASFVELVAAVGSYTTVDVTADISFERTINITEKFDVVIMSSANAVFDGQNEVRMFLVSGSTVEFLNITFANGYTDEVSGASGYRSPLNRHFVIAFSRDERVCFGHWCG